jgi:hypothetical protein
MTAELKKNLKVSPARRVAFAGMVTALSLVLLYLLNLLPTMKLSLLFVLSLLPVVLAHERRYADAVLSLAASALLSFLLFPAKGAWLLFAGFFGWYGILRELVVTKLNRVWSWVVLAAVFNIAFFALYYFAGSLFTDLDQPRWQWVRMFIVPAAEVAFIVFELFFGLCREYYIKQLRKLLFRSAV